MTSPVAKGLNSMIMSIKRRDCDYSNKEHFKAAVYSFCSGLKLSPENIKTGVIHGVSGDQYLFLSIS